jgi:hypothetical protein
MRTLYDDGANTGSANGVQNSELVNRVVSRNNSSPAMPDA